MYGIVTLATMALVLPATAFGSTLRRLEYQAVMSSMPSPNCFIENGFDYVGNDLTNVAGSADQCCDKCAATYGCKVWSWSNHNRGTCWLKSARGDIVVNPNVKSAIFMRGENPTCKVATDVDYVGNDLTRVNGAKVEDCCDICQKYAGCRAYSWSNYQGGSCWLKSKVTQVIQNPGVKSAQAYPDIYDSCLFVQFGSDYVGNDIDNKPSASYAGCCDLCKTTANCRAYSWSNHNGGTCWLKSKKGDVLYKEGVISSQVYPNPDTPQCTIQNDTDYVDNDIANVPGKDATECCDKCRNYSGCKAFAWSNQNGGTCWLKSKKGDAIAKPGVNAGTI